MADIIRREIDNAVNVNIINSQKFKSQLISIHIARPLSKKEVTLNALIPYVLKRGTKNFNRAIDIERKLEELYGSQMISTIDKKGEKQILTFAIEGPLDQFVKAEGMLLESIKLINDIVNNPYILSNEFKDTYVEQEKKNLMNRIQGRINNKKRYAVDRCIEEMCKNESYSLYKYGYVQDLKDINGKKLYEHYKEIMATSPIEISVVGNVDVDYTIKLLKENLKFDRENIIEIPKEVIKKEVKTKNMVTEEMDINQGKITMGFRTNIDYKDELYEPFLIANNILGGGPNSKLFLNVREKESLAYYINSRTYKYKGIMLISGGIDFDKFDKSIDIIKEQVEALKKGNFSDDDIDQAKKALITSIQSMTDSNYSISDFYVSRSLSKDKKDISEIINNIKNTNRGKIIEAVSKLSLDTIYFLKNKEANDEGRNINGN